MNIMFKLLPIVFSTSLSGCCGTMYQPFVPYVANDDVRQFKIDNYNCMKESMSRTEGAYMNGIAYSSSSQEIMNQALYNACMESKGYEQENKKKRMITPAKTKTIPNKGKPNETE